MTKKVNKVARLQELYHKKVVKELQKKLNLKNVMEVPRFVKITVNRGAGEAVLDKKYITIAEDELQKVTGQKAITIEAKKSIASFKVRKGWPVGAKVTLRKRRMYEFLDRLISIALPRIRDFRGLRPRSFDGRGNYSFGIQEQFVFPEIDFNAIDAVRGFDITITTTAKTDKDARALLEAFKFPIIKSKEEEGSK